MHSLVMNLFTVLCFAFASASLSFWPGKPTAKATEEISIPKAIAKIRGLESKKSVGEKNRSTLIETKNALFGKILSPNFIDDSAIVKEFLQSTSRIIAAKAKTIKCPG